MIAFFLTMPMSRMMPISAIEREFDVADHQRQQRAHAGGGQRGENGDRVDVAFIEHAEHDVDDHDGRQDEKRLALERGPEFRGAAGEAWSTMVSGSPISFCAVWIASTASPSEPPGRRLKESVTAGNWPSCMMASGAVTVLELGKRAQRHHLAGGGFDVNLVQRRRRELEVAARLPGRRGTG